MFKKKQGRRTPFVANWVEIKNIDNRVHGIPTVVSAAGEFIDISSPVFFFRTALKSVVKINIFK